MFDTTLPDHLGHPDWPDATWNISGLFKHMALIVKLIKRLDKYGILQTVESFHGCTDLLWNGGRVNNGVSMPQKDSADYFRYLNDRGIGVLLTFSNIVLEKKHLADQPSNELLDCLDEQCSLNGVIVANDLLSDYIRQRKPGLKQVASIVKNYVENPAGDIGWYKEMEGRFDRVVVHTDHVFDQQLMDQLDRDKMEILVNEQCIHQCPDRPEHQTLISQQNLFNSNKAARKIRKLLKSRCKGGADIVSDKNPGRTRSCILTREETKHLYDMGFRHFKLMGRRRPIFSMAWYIINWLTHPDIACLFAHEIYMDLDQFVRQKIKSLE